MAAVPAHVAFSVSLVGHVNTRGSAAEDCYAQRGHDVEGGLPEFPVAGCDEVGIDHHIALGDHGLDDHGVGHDAYVGHDAAQLDLAVTARLQAFGELDGTEGVLG